MSTSKKIQGISNITKLGIIGGGITGSLLEQRKAIKKWEDKCFEAKLKGEVPPKPPDSIMPYITGALKGSVIGGLSGYSADWLSKNSPKGAKGDSSLGREVALKSLAAAPLAVGLLKESMQNNTAREKLKYETLAKIEQDKIDRERKKEQMELQGRNEKEKMELQGRNKKIKTELSNQAKAKLQEYKLAKYKEKLRYKLAKKGIKMDFSYLIDGWIDTFIENFSNR